MGCKQTDADNNEQKQITRNVRHLDNIKAEWVKFRITNKFSLVLIVAAVFVLAATVCTVY